MKKKVRKSTFFLFFFVLFFVLAVFSALPFYKAFGQSRELEVRYPKIGDIQLETIDIGIAKYVKYIFNFIIIFGGLIAFGVLIWAGVRYLSSTGNPKEIEKAKKQIRSAFFGLLILFFSYLILITINPQLVILKNPNLVYLEPPQPAQPTETPSEPTTLERIDDIAKNLKAAAQGVKNYGQGIKNLAQNCDCQNTQSMCLCKRYIGGSCQPLSCRLGPDSNPCPDWGRIKKDREKVIAFKNEILYYKNRAEAESQDLLIETAQLDEKISYYEKKIEAEEDVLSKIPADEKIALYNQRKLIDGLKDIKEKLEAERNLKNAVIENINRLLPLINQLNDLTVKLAEAPDSLISSCLQRVKSFCQGSCSGGCHNAKGCFPGNCSGGNPCRINEINQNSDEISELADQIIKICDNIYSAG
jgi:hypothetical protein